MSIAMLRAELRRAMALLGTPRIADLDRSVLRPAAPAAIQPGT
jgi:isopentenyl diphosphate isomerase/L-lactate dehydrogenase-like FMN-dependent dehydrogenase